MANEAIPLAKHEFDSSKLSFPVYVSEKLDGVPVRFKIYREPGQNYIHRHHVSRQHEHLASVEKYVDRFIELNRHRFQPGIMYNFVWEVTHKHLRSFKDISGVVRRTYPQIDLVFNLFDYDASKIADNGVSGIGWEIRHSCARIFHYPHDFQIIQQIRYTDEDSLMDMLANTPMPPEQEGWAIRSHDAPFKPGTRHWDYQVIVQEPTIDLRIIRFEEGKGKNAGGVGKMIALYMGKEIGIGPGRLSYKEREELWGTVGFFDTVRIAKIKYKPDPSYAALRQPTFQAWHTKTEPDA